MQKGQGLTQNQSTDNFQLNEYDQNLEMNSRQIEEQDQQKEQQMVKAESDDGPDHKINDSAGHNQNNQDVKSQLNQSLMDQARSNQSDMDILSPLEQRKKFLGLEQFWQEKSALQIFLKQLELDQCQRFPYGTIYKPQVMSVFDEIDQQEEGIRQKQRKENQFKSRQQDQKRTKNDQKTRRYIQQRKENAQKAGIINPDFLIQKDQSVNLQQPVSLFIDKDFQKLEELLYQSFADDQDLLSDDFQQF